MKILFLFNLVLMLIPFVYTAPVDAQDNQRQAAGCSAPMGSRARLDCELKKAITKRLIDPDIDGGIGDPFAYMRGSASTESNVPNQPSQPSITNSVCQNQNKWSPYYQHGQFNNVYFCYDPSSEVFWFHDSTNNTSWWHQTEKEASTDPCHNAWYPLPNGLYTCTDRVNQVYWYYNPWTQEMKTGPSTLPQRREPIRFSPHTW